MGMFDWGGGTDVAYRVDDDAATQLRIRAFMFDIVTYITSGTSLGLTAVGFAKTAALESAAAAATAAAPVTGGAGAVVGAGITLFNLGTSGGFLLAGLGISFFSATIGFVMWRILAVSFHARHVPTTLQRAGFMVVKLIPIPGLAMVPWYTIFTKRAISASREEDRERAQKEGEIA